MSDEEESTLQPKEEGSEGLEGEQRGVYTITEIELKSIDKLEMAKTNFLLSMSNFKDLEGANSQLLDIADTMANVAFKYFKKRMPPENWIDFWKKSYTIGEVLVKGDDGKPYKKQATILDYIKKLRKYENNPDTIKKDTLRQIARNIFAIYDFYAMKLNVALPTHESNPKRSPSGKTL